MNGAGKLAHCPDNHRIGPTATYQGASDRLSSFGRIEVYACEVCGTVFGLDRNGLFVAVPDDFIADRD